jgi:hypothetical protein
VRFILILPVALLAATTSFAAEVELAPVQDAYICDCSPDETNPNGGPNFLYQGQYGSCFDRSLIRWDLSGLEEDLTIISAELHLYCEAFYGSVSGEMRYYRITETWDEGTVTYNTQPDYSDDVQATADWPTPAGWHVVDVTDFVEGWYSGDIDNYGLYCHCDGTTGTCVAGFYSKDYPVEEQRPKLVITYTAADVEETTWGEIKTLGD